MGLWLRQAAGHGQHTHQPPPHCLLPSQICRNCCNVLPCPPSSTPVQSASNPPSSARPGRAPLPPPAAPPAAAPLGCPGPAAAARAASAGQGQPGTAPGTEGRRARRGFLVGHVGWQAGVEGSPGGRGSAQGSRRRPPQAGRRGPKQSMGAAGQPAPRPTFVPSFISASHTRAVVPDGRLVQKRQRNQSAAGSGRAGIPVASWAGSWCPAAGSAAPRFLAWLCCLPARRSSAMPVLHPSRQAATRTHPSQGWTCRRPGHPGAPPGAAACGPPAPAGTASPRACRSGRGRTCRGTAGLRRRRPQ